jgi:hypothetical protein
LTRGDQGRNATTECRSRPSRWGNLENETLPAVMPEVAVSHDLGITTAFSRSEDDRRFGKKKNVFVCRCWWETVGNNYLIAVILGSDLKPKRGAPARIASAMNEGAR